jgi:hypothetical protein
MPGRSRDQRRVLFVILAATIALGPIITAAQSVKTDTGCPSLRSTDRDLMSLVAQGLAASATLRDIVRHLERSHIIIYLSRGLLPTETEARTRLISAAHGWRFLSIDFDRRLTTFDLLSRLGHELEHATEIADAREVVDEASLAALYERIGTKRSNALSPVAAYETTRAVEVERQIYRELFAAPARAQALLARSTPRYSK